MGLFDIFKKKHEQETEIDKNLSIAPNGEIHGTIPIEVTFNGRKYEKNIPVSTSVEELSQWHDSHEQNKKNPDSCERTPNDDEMLLQISHLDKYLCITNNDTFKKLFDQKRKAFFKGYNNIIVSKSDFEELEKAYKEVQDFKELTSNVYGLLNEAQESEKNGEFDKAISIYREVIGLDFYDSGYAENKPFDRLMILYKKKKDPENERAITEEAIRYLTERNRTKAIDAINKNPHLEEQIRMAETNCERVRDNNGLFCYIPYDTNKYKDRLSKLKPSKR